MAGIDVSRPKASLQFSFSACNRQYARSVRVEWAGRKLDFVRQHSQCKLKWGDDLTLGHLISQAKLRLPWVKRRANKLSHRNALLRLKGLGFSPSTIYDIGAYRAGWSRIAEDIFPTANFILFEANADNAPYIQAFGRQHFIVALAAADGDGTLFLPRSGDVTGASLYVENTSHYAVENLIRREVATARLDTIVKANGLPRPDLIKIDVQGAEIDVIEGATEAIDHCDAFIIELSLTNYNKGAPLMADVVSKTTRHGLYCVDICELHRTPTGGVFQVDFLFVKQMLFDKYAAQMGMACSPEVEVDRSDQQR